MPDQQYIVQQGDCISSIAEQCGLLPDTLWDANADLKSKRKNANALMPGDMLLIPDKRIELLPAATDQLHKYVRLGVPTKFRVILERYQQPIANKDYVLVIDGKVFSGTTSSTGLVEVDMPANAQSGKIQIPDEQIEYELDFGCLDPLDQISGAQARLQNLGYYMGDIDGQMNDEFQEALEYFQSDFGLDVTGELDGATEDKLLSYHDEEHQNPASSAPPPPDDDAGSSDDIPPDENNLPSEEEDRADFQALENYSDDDSDGGE